MHLHSLSEAGEGSWEKRGAQTLCTSAAIGLSRFCIKVQSGGKKAMAPNPRLMVWQVPLGEGSVLRTP